MKTLFNTRKLSLSLSLCLGLSLGYQAHADSTMLACNGCHGTGGVSQGAHIPTIAGLNFQYFYATMQAFKQGRRDSTVMGRIIKGFRTSQLQRMALQYGALPWTGNPSPVFDTELAERGKAIHVENCTECHERNGHFQDRETPPLAGQSKGYLLNQMRDYRAGNTLVSQPPIMQEQLEALSDQDLEALAEFFSSSLAVDQAEDAKQ